MVNKDSLICIGYISRPHSYKGDVQLTLDRKIVPLKRDDFLFLKIQGQFIPYKMNGIKGKQDEPILSLEFVDTFEKAEEYRVTKCIPIRKCYQKNLSCLL